MEKKKRPLDGSACVEGGGAVATVLNNIRTCDGVVKKGHQLNILHRMCLEFIN